MSDVPAAGSSPRQEPSEPLEPSERLARLPRRAPGTASPAGRSGPSMAKAGRAPRVAPTPPPPLVSRARVALPADAAQRGRRIVACSWIATAVFCAVAIPAASGVDGFGRPAVVTSLSLFALSIPVWIVALVRGAVRTTRGDAVDVPGLFFLTGSAPAVVRRHLFGALAVCLTVGVVTAFREPFSFLAWMLPFGLVGLWGARHGTFPPRPAPTLPTRQPPARRPAPVMTHPDSPTPAAASLPTDASLPADAAPHRTEAPQHEAAPPHDEAPVDVGPRPLDEPR